MEARLLAAFFPNGISDTWSRYRPTLHLSQEPGLGLVVSPLPLRTPRLTSSTSKHQTIIKMHLL